MNDFGKFLICMGFIITLTGCNVIQNVNSCYEIHTFTKEVFYCENVFNGYGSATASSCNDEFEHINIESYKKTDTIKCE